MPNNTVTLICSGLEFFRVDGQKLASDPPLFLFSGADAEAEFVFGPKRENWVIVFDSDELRYDRDGHTVQIQNCGVWVTLPAEIPVPPELLPGWQLEMRRIKEAWESPVPQNRCRAALGVASIFRYVLDYDAGEPDTSLAVS